MNINEQHLPKDHFETRTRVRELAGFGNRGSATSKESEALDWVISQLEASGIKAEKQPFQGRKTWASSYLLHVFLALIGAALLPFFPIASVILAVLVLLSLMGEHSTRWPGLERLLHTSPSANVFAQLPFDGVPSKRFLLMAHIDTQRTAWLWNEAAQPFFFTSKRVPIWARNAFFPILLTLGLQVVGGVALTFSPHRILAIWLAGALILIYVVSLALILNWFCSPYVPGALDNASGVAAVLSLAERFKKSPIPGVELQVLITGCEESGLHGAAAWARSNQAEKENLIFINMDCVGVAPIRYFSQETPIVGPSVPYPPDIMALAKEVASELPANPQPTALPGPTDGLALLAQGFKGITVMGLTEDGHMPNYHLMTDVAEHVDYDAIEVSTDFAWAIIEKSVAK